MTHSLHSHSRNEQNEQAESVENRNDFINVRAVFTAPHESTDSGEEKYCADDVENFKNCGIHNGLKNARDYAAYQPFSG